MGRNKVKKASNAVVEFIPSKYKNDPDLSVNAPEIENRPLIIGIRPMTRDQKFEIGDMVEVKDFKVPEKGIKGTGDVIKYLFTNNVVYFKNVLIDDKQIEILEGKEKDELWDAIGIEDDILEAVTEVRNLSELNEEESKN